MHGDAQFAGSSSVPAHVEMMGFLGMGNNPMVVHRRHRSTVLLNALRWSMLFLSRLSALRCNSRTVSVRR